MDTKTKAVLIGGYWGCILTLMMALGLFAAGFNFAGSEMIHTALKIFMLSAIVGFIIELNNHLKEK